MILDNKYELLDKLNSGSFGQVYKAKHVRTGELVAVKLERKSVTSSLKNEAKIYQYLGKEPGFTSLKWFGSNQDFVYLVTDLLVCSLSSLVKGMKALTLTNILQIGIQMIKRIETLHSKYLLHRDIKPDNFMLGTNKQLYLIDFGLCKRYDYDGRHIEETQEPGRSIIGSINFVSLNIHKGIEPGRRDDVESCIYIIAYLLSGGVLPWLNELNIQKMVDIKGRPFIRPFINDMLFLARQLAFHEEPDYGGFVAILESEIETLLKKIEINNP